MKMFGSWSRLVSAIFYKDGQDVTIKPSQSISYTAASAVELPAVDGDCVLISVGEVSSTYLSQADASTTYLSQSDAASTYLTQSNASSTYLTQSDAVATYLTQSAAASSYQPLDADLTAVAGLSANGLIAKTGAGVMEARTLQAGANGGLAVTNGDGVSGDPSVAFDMSNLISAEGSAVETTDDVMIYDVSASGLRKFNVGGLPFVPTGGPANALNDLTSSDVGILVKKADGSFYLRAMEAGGTSAGMLGWNNSSGLNGSPTVYLDIASGTALGEAPASGDFLAVADISDSNNLKKITISELAEAIGPSAFGAAADWVSGDGTSKSVVHNLGSVDVMVQVYDKADGSTIYVDSVLRSDSNTVDLTASESPGASGWRVLVQKIA